MEYNIYIYIYIFFHCNCRPRNLLFSVLTMAKNIECLDYVTPYGHNFLARWLYRLMIHFCCCLKSVKNKLSLKNNFCNFGDDLQLKRKEFHLMQYLIAECFKD